jgi:hypothetical protein
MRLHLFPITHCLKLHVLMVTPPHVPKPSAGGQTICDSLHLPCNDAIARVPAPELTSNSGLVQRYRFRITFGRCSDRISAKTLAILTEILQLSSVPFDESQE